MLCLLSLLVYIRQFYMGFAYQRIFVIRCLWKLQNIEIFLFNCFVIVFSDGAGGKGTWGKLLDTDGGLRLDRNDPNYDSGEVVYIPFF